MAILGNSTATELTVLHSVTAGSFVGNLEGTATTATTAVNLSAAPVLTASSNKITVTAGGKTSAEFTVPFATSSTSATGAGRLNASSPQSTGHCLYYYSGQPAIGTSSGNSAEGSNNSYALWSYPKNGTALNSGTSANVQNLRLQWGTTYLHDIFVSPNYRHVWHRWINNGSAKPWSRFVLEDTESESVDEWNITVKNANTVPWSGISGKPAVSEVGHTHTRDEITDFSHSHSYLPLSGGTTTGNITIRKSTTNDCMFWTEVTDSGFTPRVGLGTGASKNRGVYDQQKGWFAYIDTSGNVLFKGNADTATLATTAETANVATNAVAAEKLSTARKISLTGPITGSVNFDGSSNVSIATTPNHTIYQNSNKFGGYSGHGCEDNKYFCIAETTLSTSSNVTLAFYVSRTHSSATQKGILHLHIRNQSSSLVVYDWSLPMTIGLKKSDFVLTYKTVTENGTSKICVKIYVIAKGWNSYECSVLTNSAWGNPVNMTKFYTGQNTAGIDAIPTDETVYDQALATNSIELGNTLTFSAGSFSAKTYNNTGAVTVNIPTSGSHIGLGNVQNTAFYKRVTTVNGTPWDMAGTTNSAAFTIYAPTTAGTANQYLISNGTGAPVWKTIDPYDYNIKRSPNTFLAGPNSGTSTGSATFRKIELADLPVGTTSTTVARGNHTHAYMTSTPSSIELNTTGGLRKFGGHIDFHFHNNDGKPFYSDGTQAAASGDVDYSSRIIEDQPGEINVNSTRFKTGGNVTTAGSITASGGFKGNADTATKFSNNVSITLTGDVTGSASSQAGWTVEATLNNSGVTAGDYGPSQGGTLSNNTSFTVPTVSVNEKGIVTNIDTKTFTLSGLQSGSGTGSTASPMVGATSSANGAAGLVPQPTKGQQNYVLTGGASWKDISTLAVPVSGTSGTTISRSGTDTPIILRSTMSSANSSWIGFQFNTGSKIYVGINNGELCMYDSSSKKIYHEGNLGVFNTSVNGLVPASGTNTTKFLRGDGTWQIPANNAVDSAVNHYAPSKDSSYTLTPNPTASAYAADTVYDVITGITAERDAKGHLCNLTCTKQKIKDTTYGVVSSTANGLAPKVTDKNGFLKGNGTWAVPANNAVDSADNHYKPINDAKSTGFYKFAVDKAGHITSVTAVAATDITALGISGGSGVSYGIFTKDTHGLVPAPGVSSSGIYLDATGSWSTPSIDLPTASNLSLGVVKGGQTSGQSYGVNINSSTGAMTVSVPWTDTKVNVTKNTTQKAYLLATSTTPTTTAKGVTAISDTGVYLDSTAGTLTATTFNGDLNGTANYATSAGSASSAGSCSGNAATATALTVKSKGSATKPIYWDANGQPAACTYSLNANVPSTAAFTDEKVKCTNNNTAKAYVLGVGVASPTTGTAYGANYDTNVYLDSTAGKFVATTMYASSGFYQSSDKRLKDVHENIPVDLEKLSKLNKVYFNFKDDKETTHIGVIAQEVQEIYPELVSTDSETGMLSVSYDKLSVVALAAIDKLNDDKKNLENKIDALEERLAKLESLLEKLN